MNQPVQAGEGAASRCAARALLALLLGVVTALSACLAPARTREPSPGGLPRHRTLVLEEPALEPDRAFGESAWLSPDLAFDQALVSWNVDVVPGSGALFLVQVRDRSGRTSPWLDIGEWGVVDADRPRTIAFEGGRVDVDTLILNDCAAFDTAGLEVRVRMRSVGPAAARLRLLAVTFSDRHGRFMPAPPNARRAMPAAPVARLGVPFRSQRAAAPALAPRVCSPTSVTMVLAAAGVRVPLERVAGLAYDPLHDLYGVWPRSIQAAYELGLPGFLTRFEGWGAVHAVLDAGIPLVVSVKAGPGELGGAPYDQTDGHLLVLSGVDEAGDLLVHDPAAPDVFRGVTTYARTDLERCWLANGGTAYVLVPPERDLSEIVALL